MGKDNIKKIKLIIISFFGICLLLGSVLALEARSLKGFLLVFVPIQHNFEDFKTTTNGQTKYKVVQSWNHAPVYLFAKGYNGRLTYFKSDGTIFIDFYGLHPAYQNTVWEGYQVNYADHGTFYTVYVSSINESEATFYKCQNEIKKSTCMKIKAKKNNPSKAIEILETNIDPNKVISLINYFKKISSDKWFRSLDQAKIDSISGGRTSFARSSTGSNLSPTRNSISTSSSVIPPNLRVIGSGSGFRISKNHIITNSHVVEPCSLVSTIDKGQQLILNILNYDSTNDLGLLSGNFKSKFYLDINKSGAELGEDIVAFGFPLGKSLSNSVKITKGIVSALAGLGNNVSQIQIDAALNPGNSGGPVLNADGEVVGVAVAGLDKRETEGINFAVSSQTLSTFIKTNGINHSSSFFSSKKDNKELAEIGSKSTIQLFCYNTLEEYRRLVSKSRYSNVLLDLR